MENNSLKEICEKVHNIAEVLITSDLNDNGISLFSGKAGKSLFHVYYSKIFQNEKHYEKGINLISEIFDKISQGFSFPTFAGGLSGIGWLIEFMEQNDFLDANTNEVVGELDKYLYPLMIKETRSGNFDYLHGAGGIALYFLKRMKKLPEVKEFLYEYVDVLDEISIKEENDKRKWISVIYTKDNHSEKVYNLSMSHGIASIISVLSKMYAQDINKLKSEKMLIEAINYLLSYQQDTKEYSSYFPNTVSLENHRSSNSRLAWCYGDLGISVSLWNASQVLENKDLESKAVEILSQTAERKDLKRNRVDDAGLCHGTAGIAHIYIRAFQYTDNEKFKEASEYWFDQTLKMAKFEDGLASYKTWATPRLGGWKNDCGFLTGITGIGLSLLTAISDNEPKWDECLLLS